MKLFRILFLSILTIEANISLAQLHIPSFFSDNTVLQRETNVNLWRWSDAGS